MLCTAPLNTIIQKTSPMLTKFLYPIHRPRVWITTWFYYSLSPFIKCYVSSSALAILLVPVTLGTCLRSVLAGRWWRIPRGTWWVSCTWTVLWRTWAVVWADTRIIWTARTVGRTWRGIWWRCWRIRRWCWAIIWRCWTVRTGWRQSWTAMSHHLQGSL